MSRRWRARFHLTSETWLTNIVVGLVSLLLGWTASNVSAEPKLAAWQAIVLLILVFIAVAAVGLMITLRQEIVRDNTVTVEWCKDFDKTAELVAAAKHKIVVATSIGARRNRIPPGPSRSGYLDAITEKIRHNPDIRYLRLMPASEADYDRLLDKSLKLSECDTGAAEHLRAIEEVLSSQENGNTPAIATGVSVKICKSIALLPSTVVIDEDHVCFALPRKLTRPIDGVSSMIKDVLVISDKSGEIPRKMASIIDSVADEGHDILRSEFVDKS